MGEIVRSDTGGELSRTYWHKDLLGSPEVLTNAAGSVIHRQHFSAFGISDNPTWQSSNPAVRRVRRGYTGHEHDPETGLVNMGARLYDGVTARFMTPDPGVQMPGWTQSWNRFSYVWNNPMSFVDPTGLEGEGAGADVEVMPPLIVNAPRPEAPTSSETPSDIPVAEVPPPESEWLSNGTSPVESPAPLTPPAGAAAPDVATPAGAPGTGTGDETAPPSRERNWENAQKGFRNGALDEIEFFIDLASLNPLNFFRRNSVINALKASVPSDPQGRSQYDNAHITVSVIVAAATIGAAGIGEAGAAEAEEVLEGVPKFIFRTGSQTEKALTDVTGVSFRNTVSSSADARQVFRSGDKIWAVDTSKLRPGSVVLDNNPAGHVSVRASPAEIRAATVPSGPGNPLHELLRNISGAFYRL